MSAGQKLHWANHIHPWTGRSHTEETKQKLSELAKQRSAAPGYVNPMQGKTHTPEAIAKICKDRVGSSLEVRVAEILLENGYDFYHQFFVNHNGKCHSYDFKLKDLPILVEADGNYWHGGPGLAKHFIHVDDVIKNDREKDQIANTYGYGIIHVWESEIYSNPQILLDKINQLI